MSGPWTRQIGSGQTGDGNSELWHSRNQRTKMDKNGWIELRWPLYLLLWAGIPEKNGVAIMVNKKVRNAVLGCNLKNDTMISVHFQGKPFNITVIQVYAPTSNAEEAEVEWFYEDLQDLLELTPQKRCPFHYRSRASSAALRNIPASSVYLEKRWVPRATTEDSTLW